MKLKQWEISANCFWTFNAVVSFLTWHSDLVFRGTQANRKNRIWQVFLFFIHLLRMPIFSKSRSEYHVTHPSPIYFGCDLFGFQMSILNDCREIRVDWTPLLIYETGFVWIWNACIQNKKKKVYHHGNTLLPVNKACQWFHQLFTEAWFERTERTELVKKRRHIHAKNW